ncbi:hypothetical protein L916_00297 [Phytophthora nicotianae]|uniref:Uncharacterized protein n=1 Tax=Phytophthora nicotianae TaxID=4792 RepID=W2JVL6_PHYNI|nr:hypothetical protein L916_00297 [Phytophthora nicotianae]
MLAALACDLRQTLPHSAQIVGRGYGPSIPQPRPPTFSQ